MDFNQIWTVVKAFLKSLIDSWYVIFTILGVFIFISSFFIPDELWKTISYSTGILIVVSGSFSAMTRWLSIHGIVKKELQNILYGSTYLKDKDNFNLVWDKLVTIAVDEYMPSLGTLLGKEFLREYLPSEKEIFYKEYHQVLDVYWEDKSKKIIKVVEKTNITFFTTNTETHNLEYKFFADFPKEKNLNYEVETLKIDGACMLSDVIFETSEKDNTCYTKISYDLKVSGKKEYTYFRKMSRLICLDYEPFIVLASGKHTYKPKVTVNCHDSGIKAYFTSTGTLHDFVTIDGQNNSAYMQEEYPELMMKAQGYSIYFAAE